MKTLSPKKITLLWDELEKYQKLAMENLKHQKGNMMWETRGKITGLQIALNTIERYLKN